MFIEDIMTIPVSKEATALAQQGLFVDHDDEVFEAFAIMTEHGLDSIPVVGPALEVVGIVSYQDAAQRLG